MAGEDHLEIVKNLLSRSFLGGDLSGQDFFRISSDGSDRIFYRVIGRSHSLIAVFPGSRTQKDLNEAKAGYLIGDHLYRRGVPVPKIFVFDREHDAILFEDCGNLHLHDVLLRQKDYTDDIDGLYHKTIDGLVLFQIEGWKGFDPGFCWDTPRYDMDLMLRRESGYFLSSFCHDYMGIIPADPGLSLEFQRLARRAARLPRDYLLHRDFQSRNILVHQEDIRIIDFQGARFGPLGYDLASLLIDPYAGLSREQQNNFLEYYLSEISARISFNQEEFRDGYYLLALQRNLQILGAFACLTQIKGRKFFQNYINPALHGLYLLLQDIRGEDYPRLRELAGKLQTRHLKSGQLYGKR